MAQLEQRHCEECGAQHVVHRHELTCVDVGRLQCPDCEADFLVWVGRYFYTLAVFQRPAAETTSADDT